MSASHLVGGIITYKCVGNGEYVIYLKRTFDFTGISPQANTSLRLVPVDGSPYILVQLDTIYSEVIPIEPQLPCFGINGTNDQVIEFVYASDTIVLPPGTAYDVYEPNGQINGECCRIELDNVNLGIDQKQVLFTRIPDPSLQPCNFPPEFDRLGPYLCKDVPISYDFEVTDADGDSLVYYYCDAFTDGPYTPPGLQPFPAVPYTSGYSGSNPVSGNPGLAIDSFTGQITGTPDQLGVYLTKVCIDEYRNDSLIGHYGKEMVNIVVDCSEVDAEINTNHQGDIVSCSKSVDFSVSPSLSSHFWQFDYPNGQDTSALQNPTYTYPDTGTYTAMYIAEPGAPCADTNFVTVKILDSLQHGLDLFSFNGKNQICPGDSVKVKPSGADAYQWISPTFNCDTCSSQKVAPDSATTYFVKGYKYGCVEYDSTTISIIPPLDILTLDTVGVCENDSIRLNAKVGSNQTWKSSSFLSCLNCKKPYAYPDSNTWFFVEALDIANNCISMDSIFVFVQSYPAINVSPKDTAICYGDSVKLEALSNENTYSWSTGDSTSTITVVPDSSKDYILSVWSSIGCTTRDTSSVTVNYLQEGTFGSDTSICSGDTAQLYSAGFQSYSWMPGSALSDSTSDQPNAFPNTSTTYEIAVSDSNGCKDTGSVNLTVWPLPKVGIAGDSVICEGDTTTLSAHGGKEYQWTATNNVACDNCQSISVQPDSSTYYHVEVTDSNGCSAQSSVNVIVHENPWVEIVPSDTAICQGEVVTLQAASSANQFSWSNGATGMMTSVSPIADTSYVVMATDSFGCSSTDTITITVNALQPGNFIGDTSICAGDSIQLFAQGFQSYQWAPGHSLSDPSVSEPVAFPDTSTTFEVMVQDANGCTDTSTVILTVDPLPDVTTMADTSICKGDTITIHAAGAVQYAWSPPNQVACETCATTTSTTNSTTNFVVIGTDANQCSNTSELTVTVHDNPLVEVTPDTSVICQGDSAMLKVGGADLYNWLPTVLPAGEDSFIANPGYTTTYAVEGTDTNGCSDTGQATIIVDSIKYIHGIISQSNGNPLASSKVLLFEYDQVNDTVYLIDSVQTDMNGHYTMESTKDTFYMLALPDSNSFPDELPTYYDSSLTLQGATEMTYQDCDSLEVNFSTILDQSTGIDQEGMNKMAITIHPNPADDRVHVQLKNADRSAKVLIYNNTGQLVKVVVPRQQRFELDTGRLPAGLYFIKVHDGQKQLVEKMQIVH